MRQTIIGALIVIFLAICLFVPFFSGQSVYMTKVQKDRMNEFCSQHGCGAIVLITPYQFVKDSIYNFIVRN